MKTRIKKAIITFLVIINIFSLTAAPAHADLLGVALGNPMALMDTVMGAFGVNKDEIQNTMKSVNVARKKVTPPTVSLTFDPVDPVPGEKVTVTTTPSYFMNMPENLYFTWYIKSARCFDDKLDHDKYTSDYKKSDDFKACDLNGDGEVDIEDYKMKAMRILASNDFDWQNADYSSDTDNDGYSAPFGGDDQRGKKEHCFVHDVKSGDDNEIACHHLFPNAPGHTTGDNEFDANEEKFWHTNPKNKDTAGTGHPDEANIVGLGENVFSFSYSAGDQVGVAVEGVSIQPTQISDSSYETMWAFTKNTCGDKNNIKAGTGNSDYPKTTEDTTTTYPNTKAISGSTSVPPPAATDYTTTISTKTVEDIAPNTNQVNDNATIRTTTTIHTVVTYVGTDPQLLSETQLNETITSHTCSPSELESGTTGCSGADEYKSIKMTNFDINNLNDCLYENLVTPTEGGGAKEKLDVSLKYLPENPINDTSSSKNGDTLSLTASVPNANNAAYLSYTWEVYASDEANPDDWGNPLPKTALDGSTQTSGLGINTLKFNLNFPSPKKYLKVKVTVKETLAGGGAEREGHADITTPISSSGEYIKVYTAGLVYLNQSDATPTAEINASGTSDERCLADIPEKKSDGSITTSPVPAAVCEVAKDELIGMKIDNGTAANPTYTDFLWTVDGAPLTCADEHFKDCFDASGKTGTTIYFPVLKNIGDQYNISLSALNKTTGKRIDLSKVFKISSPDVKIVPEGKDNQDTSGKPTCLGLVLGEYKDFNNTSYPDHSDTSFQARTGNNIVLTPVFSGTVGTENFNDTAGQSSNCPYQWNIDGTTINADNARNYGYMIDTAHFGRLTLPPKNVGEKYIISLSTTFTPTNSMRQMLNKYWDVTYNEFYEKKLTHNIEIEMVSNDTTLSQKETSPGKVLATVSSGIPSYFAFLFRMALSGLAIILAIKIIFFVLPKRTFDEF